MPSINLTASQEAYDASIDGFLEIFPISVDEKGEPIMTVAAMVRQKLAEYYYSIAKQGLIELAGKAVTLEKVFE